MQSVDITTNVVSSNPSQGRCTILDTQLYAKKTITWLHHFT